MEISGIVKIGSVCSYGASPIYPFLVTLFKQDCNVFRMRAKWAKKRMRRLRRKRRQMRARAK
ncbi:hypothetical protein JH06_2919 [Blastocystis sp. subtype 4]|uniref:hypothetical protein n=1 Tax=Blastocystis sp. subtype 4 TaxID=944170 RepID=UPI00071144E8|nr:hypothetical protein JH06_2919 [Blastocystis sp. subtype 4]KNB43244.1 hypothetical protein JH06_2919 [Blastocystis sp. subtype 4]|eukprot:XP_014526687.1 hypothetical protein JH06_2919 [Blastocystis sp. subtype 4]